MIDDFSILFSTFSVLLVAVRAIILDRRLPWFTHGRGTAATVAAGSPRPDRAHAPANAWPDA